VLGGVYVVLGAVVAPGRTSRGAVVTSAQVGPEPGTTTRYLPALGTEITVVAAPNWPVSTVVQLVPLARCRRYDPCWHGTAP
jgi:hypothetical protein